MSDAVKTARRSRGGSAQPAIEDDGMRKDAHNLMPHVAEICADEAAMLALSVTRFVAAGYMTSDVACWDAAYDTVERALGPVRGPTLVARLTAVMRAIRLERQADWRFMPASCCRVTEDERGLVELVQSARERRWREVAARAAALAGATAAPCLAAAVRAAAEALDNVEPEDGFREPLAVALH